MDCLLIQVSIKHRLSFSHYFSSQTTENYLKISGTSNKSGASQQKAPAKKGIKCKYKEDYVKYGFVASGSDDHQLPLCIICNLTLSNEALAPNQTCQPCLVLPSNFKLVLPCQTQQTLIETNLESLKDKPKAYFENFWFLLLLTQLVSFSFLVIIGLLLWWGHCWIPALEYSHKPSIKIVI